MTHTLLNEKPQYRAPGTRSLPSISLAALFFIVVSSAANQGCGGVPGAFATSFPDNDESDMHALLARIGSAPIRQYRSIAVGVTAHPSKLYAFDLQAEKVLWQKPSDTWVAPLLAGDWVATQESGGIILRDLDSGARRLALDEEGMSLKGADAQGELLALVLTKGSGSYALSEVVAVRNGRVAWRRELEGTAGAPAVVGKTVLVPWNHQYLSALDGTSGNEFARIRVLDTVVGHVFVNRGQVYAGSDLGIFPLTVALLTGQAKAGAFFALPERKLPGQPLLLADMYSPDPIPAPDSARHHIQLGWLPEAAAGQQLGLEDNNLYLVFYRFIVAFYPESYAVRWIYTHPEDLVGARAQAGGIRFADEAGEMGFLAASNGQKKWSANSGLPSLVVRISPGPVALQPDAEGASGPPSLVDQLMTVAQHPDARLVPIRLLSVQLLAELDDPLSTAGLIELCDNRRNTPPVRKAACEALANREVGSDHVLAALQHHAAFLEGTTAPPVGSLAKAAVRLKEQRAVGLLIAHLRDPSTASKDLPPLVVALKELNDRAAVQPLIDFLRMYHADAPDEDMTEALGDAADALVVLSGPAVKEVLEEVVSDELGNPKVRDRVRVALNVLRQQEEQAEQSDAEKQAAMEEEAKAETAAAQEAPLHRYLTKSLVEEALQPASDRLQACLSSGKTKAASARLLIVVHKGDVLSVHVVPRSIQSCVEPIVRSQKFPITRTGKERVTYDIKGR